MARRVVIGAMPDGSVRLRTSRPGYDALTAPDSPDYISFDSNWTDRVQIHKVGIADLVSGPPITFANLGYTPFVDIRQYVGGVIYDDYVSVQATGDPDETEYYYSGYPNAITSTGVANGAPLSYWRGETQYNFGQYVLYVVYKLSVT